MTKAKYPVTYPDERQFVIPRKKKTKRKPAPKRLYAAVWWFQNEGDPIVASASKTRQVSEAHAAFYGEHSEVITYTRQILPRKRAAKKGTKR